MAQAPSQETAQPLSPQEPPRSACPLSAHVRRRGGWVGREAHKGLGDRQGTPLGTVGGTCWPPGFWILGGLLWPAHPGHGALTPLALQPWKASTPAKDLERPSDLEPLPPGSDTKLGKPADPQQT